MVAVADEIAAAAELVMGKTERVPAAVVRGLDVGRDGTARELVMPAGARPLPLSARTSPRLRDARP